MCKIKCFSLSVFFVVYEKKLMPCIIVHLGIRQIFKTEIRSGSLIAVVATSKNISSLHKTLTYSRGQHFFSTVIDLKPPNHVSWRCLCGFEELQWDVIDIYSVSQKKSPPCGFLKFFPKRMGIFNQFFTHLLHVPFYTRLQIFIQLAPTLTKLCHTKCDHPTNFYISLEV